jgi:hypothetical protein
MRLEEFCWIYLIGKNRLFKTKTFIKGFLIHPFHKRKLIESKSISLSHLPLCPSPSALPLVGIKVKSFGQNS